MNLLAHAIAGLEAALLPVATALLLEELTYGGLVRLLLAPRPKTRKHGAVSRWSSPQERSPKEPSHRNGGGK